MAAITPWVCEGKGRKGVPRTQQERQEKLRHRGCGREGTPTHGSLSCLLLVWAMQTPSVSLLWPREQGRRLESDSGEANRDSLSSETLHFEWRGIPEK